MFAVYHRAKNVAALFIRKGADVNAVCASGLNALTYAIHANDQDPEGEMVQFLVENGATLDPIPITPDYAQEASHPRTYRHL